MSLLSRRHCHPEDAHLGEGAIHPAGAGRAKEDVGGDSFWGGLLAAPAVYSSINKMSINAAQTHRYGDQRPCADPLEVDIGGPRSGTAHAGVRKLTGVGDPANGRCAVLQVLQGVERPAVDTDLKQQMRTRAEPRVADITDQISGVELLAHADGNLRKVRV